MTERFSSSDFVFVFDPNVSKVQNKHFEEILYFHHNQPASQSGRNISRGSSQHHITRRFNELPVPSVGRHAVKATTLPRRSISRLQRCPLTSARVSESLSNYPPTHTSHKGCWKITASPSRVQTYSDGFPTTSQSRPSFKAPALNTTVPTSWNVGM